MLPMLKATYTEGYAEICTYLTVSDVIAYNTRCIINVSSLAHLKLLNHLTIWDVLFLLSLTSGKKCFRLVELGYRT